MNYPKVSIIILNWNGLKDTIECLESVYKIDYPNYDIIVVDNGSIDGSQSEIGGLFPKAVLIRNSKNLGYAEGNNVGIRAAMEKGAEFILILNNDAVVDSNVLRCFVNAAQDFHDVGIFGGKICYYSDRTKIWTIGGEWDHVKNNFYHIGKDQHENNSVFNKPTEVKYISGCALFFRRSVVERIGLFNASYFLTYEETDWCFRARRAGFRLLYIPSAKIFHKVSVSFGGDGSPLYVYYLTRNRLLWAQRNMPIFNRIRIYLSAIGEIMPNAFTQSDIFIMKRLYWDALRILRIFKKPVFKSQIFGVTDFLLRRFGECKHTICYLDNE